MQLDLDHGAMFDVEEVVLPKPNLFEGLFRVIKG